MPRILLGVVVSVALGLLLLGTGCKHQDESATSTEKMYRLMDHYGKLPGLRASHNKELQDELARLEVERATPELLAEDAKRIPDEKNAAFALGNIFSHDVIPLIDERARKLYPAGKFQFDPISLQKAIEFRQEYEEQRLKICVALARPECDFHYQHMKGRAADQTFIDLTSVALRLEAFLAAEALADDDPDKAIESLAFMLCITRFLGQEKSLSARSAAAGFRADTLEVLAAIAQHPKATRETLENLLEKLNGQMAAWPPDANAWIGERATGLHTYEIARGGYVQSLLTIEELQEFRKDGTLGGLLKAVAANYDTDELQYLQMMQTIIDSCKLPYYQRKPIFWEIRKDLQRQRNTPEFPIIATRILLADFEEGHEIQAKDRARCEAFVLALSKALGRKPPDYKINPYTGKPYQVTRNQTRVVVRGIGLGREDHPVIIPIPATKKD